MSEALEIARKARQTFTIDRFVQNSYYERETGRACLLGHIGLAAGAPDYELSVYYLHQRLPQDLKMALTNCAGTVLEYVETDEAELGRIITVNDSLGYAAASQVLDCTIAKLEAQEA